MAPDTKLDTRTDHAAPEGAGLRGRWHVVPERSRVGFRVKKMGLYRVKGRFRHVAGEVELGPDRSAAELDVDASSISTRMPPRDLHLRSRDFLDVKRHPRITVSADSVDAGPGGALRVQATLEIRGRRGTVDLVGRVEGGEVPILHLAGTLDRREFGIRPRQPFAMVVGREVELDAKLVLGPTT